MSRQDYINKCIQGARTLPGLSEADQKLAAEICWTASNGEGNGFNYANDGTSTLNKLGNGQLTQAERDVARQSLNYPHDKVGRNLDSMGMLQQRPSADWGPPSELMDPYTSFMKFYNGAGYNKGLMQQKGWQTMTPAYAAWSVQQCAPDDMWVYEQAAVKATAEIDAAWGSVGPTPPPPEEEDRTYFRVYRMAGVDYVACPGRFRALMDPDDYHFMFSTGWIDVPHGEGQEVERNLLEYIREEAARGSLPGGVSDIIN
jgi:hypothetical protein